MSEALGLENVVVGEGAFRLGPISLEVEPGRTLAVVGPNGAGKSSLLRALAGLRRPRSGRVHRPGPAAWLPPPGEVQTALDVLTVVTLGRASRRPWAPDLSPADRAVARAALTDIGLADLADRPFDTLSSGQRQLALIARLTVQDAPVCLVDEPTALLDPVHSARVAAALSGLAQQGRTVVIATHDLALAARADRVLLLGPEPVELAPAEGLSPERLAQVFGAPVGVCPCCGHPAVMAAPDDTIGSRV